MESLCTVLDVPIIGVLVRVVKHIYIGTKQTQEMGDLAYSLMYTRIGTAPMLVVVD